MTRRASYERRLRASPALVLLLAGCATGGGGRSDLDRLPPLPSDVTVTLQEEEYAVFGQTIAEIGESLRRRGPRSNNQEAVGLHSHRYTWEFDRSRTPTGCRVDGVRIHLTSTIEMPRWTLRGSADVEMGMLWDEYWDLLWMHEERHRAYAFEHVAELHRRLTGLSAPDCAQLSRAVETVARQLSDKYRRLNSRFDAASAPNTTHGPRWPPRPPR